MVKNVNMLVDIMADVVAETVNSAFLGMKLAVNAFKQYGCQFDKEGNFNGECPKMEKPEEWLV